jgi:hypothetical protein
MLHWFVAVAISAEKSVTEELTWQEFNTYPGTDRHHSVVP